MTMLAPWPWTCSLQSCENIHFYCWNKYSVVIICYGSPSWLIQEPRNEPHYPKRDQRVRWETDWIDGNLTIKAGQSKEIQGRANKPPKRQKENEECAKRGDLKKAGVLCRSTVWGKERVLSDLSVKSLLTSETIPGKRERLFSPSLWGQAAWSCLA